MKLIVNVDKNWAIGNSGKLLFPLSQDMKFFKSHTINNIIVMGRKTLDSFPGGKPLANRTNIVLSRNPSFEREGVTVCNNGGELALLLRDVTEDVYVIGGESLYRDLLPFCDTAYVTKVDAKAETADAFMVNLDESPDWVISEESDIMEEKGLKFKFVTYTRNI
ncbi:MAG: dihydrofolate reductase [Oscillospiraceae bacterium]|nr:dihydrofolate reductase [Oscillospiraceae bacterium]